MTEVIDNGHALHLASDGRTLCGKPVDDRDRYVDAAHGWEAWGQQEDRRCGRCSQRYARQAADAMVARTLPVALLAAEDPKKPKGDDAFQAACAVVIAHETARRAG